MVRGRSGRRILIATLTVVAALLPVSMIAAVAALGDAPGGNGGGGPAIVGFAPHHGSIRGGTVVHISGGGFIEVTGVAFGGRQARSFVAKSDNVVDAVAPRVPRGNAVPIRVTGAGGTATSSARFAFVGCHVPHLKHDRVREARRAIVAAGCKVGHVRRARGARRPLRAIAQRPRPNAWLAPGTRVRLRVR